MNRTTEVLSQALENEGQNQKVTQQHNANGDGPRLIACVLLLPEDAEVLAGLLRTLATNSHASQDIDAVARPDLFLRPEPSDSWLEHTAAAEYLEVSRSTLYRYAEHHDIESRKFGGRLEYRLSSLDEFKAHHVRPVRRSLHESGIIPSAPRSGK